MHNAPAVNFPVGRSALQGGLIAGAALLILLADILWIYQVGQIGWTQWGALAMGVLTCLLACWDWMRQPSGRLRWDGSCWSWLADDVERSGLLAVRLDWQRFMLLEFQPDRGAARWFWVSRHWSPDSWEGLRRAVFAAPRTVELAGPQTTP